MAGIAVAPDGDGSNEAMLSLLVSGCSKAGSTCVPMEVALSCSARFKASWIRLIVSFPWGDPVVPIGAAGRPVLAGCVRPRPDQNFQMTEPAQSWRRWRFHR